VRRTRGGVTTGGGSDDEDQNGGRRDHEEENVVASSKGVRAGLTQRPGRREGWRSDRHSGARR
jgi:hypothetical protein